MVFLEINVHSDPVLKPKTGHFELFGCTVVLTGHSSLGTSMAANAPPEMTLILFIRGSLFQKLEFFGFANFRVVFWLLEDNIVYFELN